MIYIKYLWSVLRHKWFVLQASVEINASLGLALIHDLSKFRPTELVHYARYFCGNSGNQEDFDIAWLTHIYRNKHHWQYWVLREDDGAVICKQMPYRYMMEMVADWIGASKAYGSGNAYQWYRENKQKILLHPVTRAVVELELEMWNAIHFPMSEMQKNQPVPASHAGAATD